MDQIDPHGISRVNCHALDNNGCSLFNVIHSTHIEHSLTLTAVTEVSRGLSQLILLTDYMSCFEMAEERPVTSGRNLGGREVVSSIQGIRIDHQTRDFYPSRWSTCFQEAFLDR